MTVYPLIVLFQVLLSCFLFVFAALMYEREERAVAERVLAGAAGMYLLCLIGYIFAPHPRDFKVVEASWQRLPCTSKVTIEHQDGSSETRVLPEGSRVFVVSKDSAFK